MYILGIDPGFASLGWAICTQEQGKLHAQLCGVITTEKSTKKLNTRSSEDNIRRAQNMYTDIAGLLTNYPINMVCTETMSWPRNAGVVAKMGIAWGVIASACHQWRVMMLQASPMEIKRAVTGDGKASKERMIASIKSRFPELSLPPQETLQEHAADAVGAVIACQESQLFKAWEHHARGI
jgi:crossover junction endodeoxyribonuclease RuvC